MLSSAALPTVAPLGAAGVMNACAWLAVVPGPIAMRADIVDCIGIGDATAWTACNWNPSTSWSTSSAKITALDERRLTGNQRLTGEVYTEQPGRDMTSTEWVGCQLYEERRPGLRGPAGMRRSAYVARPRGSRLRDPA